MIIGIVSKPDHAKNHAAALEQDGHTIRLLGSSPVEFPQDIDVMVLRHLSSSHGGLERARNHAKARRIPIVAENGLSGIRMAINAMNNKHIHEFTMETNTFDVSKPMQIEVDENAAIADAVISGKPNSFVKQLLSSYSKLPARFLYRCMTAFDGKALPPEANFVGFFNKLNPNEDIQRAVFNTFYMAGFKVLSLKPAERVVIRNAFMSGDAGNGSFFPSPMLPAVDSLKGHTNAFLSFYMWLLAEDRPKRTSIVNNAYHELSDGKQADPRAFAKYRDAFGFEMTMLQNRSKPAVAVAAAPAVEASAFEAVEGKILKTVQDEILDISIRLEEAVNVTKRVDLLDKGLASANASITRFEALLRDLSQAPAANNKGNLFFEERFKKAAQDYANLKDWVNTIQNEQRQAVVAMGNLQTHITTLAEQVKALSSQVKALAENRPTTEAVNLESTLRTLKSLGASVTITLPA